MNAGFLCKCFLMATVLVMNVPVLSCSGKLNNARSEAVSEGKLVDDVLAYINEYRQGKGLNALQMNPVISGVAAQHSSDMANNKTPFGHEGFEKRIGMISQQLGSFHQSAENVAYGNLNARQVVDIWLKSPGHRRNIEGKYTVTGIGTATNADGIIFFTQIFAAK